MVDTLAIGQVQWHCSDDECSGPDVGSLLRLSEDDYLWEGEITRDEAEAAGVSDMGRYLVLHRGKERVVVGTISNQYDGAEFMEALSAALRKKPVEAKHG